MTTINQIHKDTESKMLKRLEAFRINLTKLRTGRAHPSLLEHVKVSYYGTETPLSQVANIIVGDARTLVVSAWDKSMLSAIEKAIMTADLGLNPVNLGETIRVPLPALNEERRRELARLVRAEAEEARVAVRNVRREANSQLKDLQKDKIISTDDEKRGEELIQKLTDKLIGEIDKIIAAKENELMEV